MSHRRRGGVRFEPLEERTLLTVTFAGGVLTIIGDMDFDGQNDSIFLTRDPGDTSKVIGNLNATAIGPITLANIDQIVIQGRAGDDTLTVDSSSGLLTIPSAINFDGGTGFDRVNIRDTSNNLQNETLLVGAEPGKGQHRLVDNGINLQRLDFENIEPFTSSAISPSFSINEALGVASFLQSSNDITVQAGSALLAPPSIRITVDSFEPIEIKNKQLLVINAGEGDDKVVIDGDLEINYSLLGGQGFDTLEYIGDGTDIAAYMPLNTDPGAGTLNVQGDIITFAGFEPLTVSNLLAFTLTTPNSQDRILVQNTPLAGRLNVSGTSGGIPFENVTFFDIAAFQIDTATNDAGMPDDIVTLDAPLPAQGLTSFVVNGGQGTDRVVYNGTAINDTFVVDNAGVITLTNASNAFLTVSSNSSFEELVLNGLAGDDTFTLTGTPYRTTITGGDPSAGSDVLNLRDPGDAQTVTIRPDLTDATKQVVVGLGPNSITASGVELITYHGRDGNDQLTVALGNGDNVARVERFANAGEVERSIVHSDSLPDVAFGLLNVFQLDTGLGTDLSTFATRNLRGVTPSNYRLIGDALDTLVIEGADSASDNYTVSNPAGAPPVLVIDGDSTIVVTVNGELGLLRLNTLGRDDLVNVDVGATDVIGVPIQYDGGDGSDRLAILGTPATTVDEVIYTPGPAITEGRLIYEAANNSRLMTIDFVNLEPVVDLVPAATLTVNGTASANEINYEAGSAATRGLVSVDDFESIEFSNKTNLVINALAGPDHVLLNNANLPTGLLTIAVDGGSGDDELEALNVFTAVPATNMRVTLRGGSGNDRLDAHGVTQNTPFTFDGGAGDDLLVGHVTNILAGAADQDIYEGGTGFDSLVVQGTLGNDVIDVFQLAPGAGAADNYRLRRRFNNLTATVDITKTNPAAAPSNAANRPTVEEVRLNGDAGNDLFRVTHADQYVDDNNNNGVPAQMLRFAVDGGSPAASDRLVVRDDGVGDLMLVRQSAVAGSGRVTLAPVVNLFLGDVVYDHVERLDIVPVNDPTQGGTGPADPTMQGRIVVFQPDPFELNDNRLIPTEFSDLGTTHLNPTIDPGGNPNVFGEDDGVPGDEDWYSFTPSKTSTFRFDVLFDVIATVASGRPGLPGNGQLAIAVYASDGSLVKTGTTVSGAGEQVTFGAQGGHKYFLRVKGAALEAISAAINTYQVKLTEVDDLGPQVTSVFITGHPGYNLFDPKPTTSGPTPLVDGLSIGIRDLPARAPGFLYPALVGGTVTESEPNSTLADAQGIDQYFNLVSDPNIGNQTQNTSTTIPHATIKATGNGTFDYFSFTVNAAGQRGIFDIDFGAEGGINTQIFLYDEAGTLLASNDDSSITFGAGGSTSVTDSYLEHVFAAPGKYIIGVGRFASVGSPGGITGNAPLAGQSYSLQVSIEGHTVELAPGLFQLRGDNEGLIPIKQVQFVPDPIVIGQPATGTLLLTFFHPLPDDRFTLTILDALTDPAGNPLDGESNAAQPLNTPTFPSGNGHAGGIFVARFTVDSRPEIGTYAGITVSTDLNGNRFFDPSNADFTNRDVVFQFGLPSDHRFVGRFGPPSALGTRFDVLAAYGNVNGQFRFLIDFNANGRVDAGETIVSPLQIDGLAVGGDFDNNPATADQIALFDGTTWFLDVLGGATAVNAGISGYPLVGDFDGDGKTDLATYQHDAFFFNLGNNGFGGGPDYSIGFGAPGVLDRALAADVDQDGITDIGLWIPYSGTNLGEAEWRFIVSDDRAATKRVVGQVNTLNRPFTPAPFGPDFSVRFGDPRALPLIGNFDPPATSGTSGGSAATAPPQDPQPQPAAAGTSAGAASAAARTAQQSVGVVLTTLTTTTDSSGREQVFAIGTDGQVWSETSDGQGGYSEWKLTTAGGVRQIGAVTDAANRAYVFALGADSQVWYTSAAPGGGWSGWTLSRPGGAQQIAVTTRSGRPQVFILGGDNQVWTETTSGDGNWSPWTLTQAGAVRGISATTDSAGRLYVVAVGMDDQVWYQTSPGNGAWTAWALTQSRVVQQVASTVNQAGLAQVFAIGADGQVWTQSATAGGGWGAWTLTQPGVVRKLAAGRGVGNRPVVYTIFADQQVWSEKVDEVGVWGNWALTHAGQVQ